MTSRQSAVQAATDQLRDAILHGEFEPGQHLAEVDLADRLAMSRTPVREALRALAAEGLVELRAGRGAVVIDLRDESIEALFDLRIRVEGMAAARAARRTADNQLHRLQDLAERILDIVTQADGQPDPDQLAEIYELNALFHGLIIDASGSRAATRTFRELIHMVVLMRTYQAFDDAAMRRSAAHHLELIAALKARDSHWAEAVMTAHLLSARASLLGPRP